MNARRRKGSSRILLAEDDRETSQLIASSLADEGYQVTAVDRGATATSALDNGRFSAVILDVRLPDTNGIALCRQWRRNGIGLPILMLTALTSVPSRIEGLDSGADDYLGKPFALAELKARLNALLRRGEVSPGRPRAFQVGEIAMDFACRRVSRAGTEIPFTRRELELLERLVSAEGRAVSREDLMEGIWGESTPEAAASLEVILGRLRRKLDPSGAGHLIRTFRGFGYAFVAPDVRTMP